MKFTKKIATILLSVCLIVPCFSVMALAANGVIFFSDLETSVGDEFTITGTAVVSGDVIGDATIHMTYDPSYMRFEEGDGVNADTDGNLTFRGSGDGSSDRIEFTMKFQALQEGSTRLEQGDAMVTDSWTVESRQTVFWKCLLTVMDSSAVIIICRVRMMCMYPLHRSAALI